MAVEATIVVGNIRHFIKTDMTMHEIAMAPILGKPIKSCVTDNEFTFSPDRITIMELR